MSNKQQTAVNWLIKELFSNNIIPEYTDILINIAKEMEKQQIINAVDGFPIQNRNMLGEEYYKETYEND